MAATDEQNKDWATMYGKVVAKAWNDEAYKARLLSDPRAALSEVGVELPAGIKEIRVVENTEDTVNLVLPAIPPAEELSEEALEKVSGGLFCTGTFTICH